MLLELMLALVSGAIVIAAAVGVIVRAERFHAGVEERIRMSSRLRAGGDVLAASLRYGAMEGAPISLATDTAVELATVIGAATTCAPAAAGRVALVPDSLASGAALTGTVATPDSADDVLVWHVASSAQPTAGWDRARVVSVSVRAAGSVCPIGPLVSVADIASRAQAFDLTVAPAIGANAGAPVRIVRQARFSVYRASDGLWYLGYRRCPGGQCGTIQPVSGPYAGSGGAPVTLRYFDLAGAIATPVALARLGGITRVDAVLRSRSASAIDLPGVGRGVARDSVVVTIAPRNAP
jgi:hypothetical protein